MQVADAFERQLMSKITWKLIPFLCICYMAAFLDRVNVGFAKLQMLDDLKWDTAIYGTGAGIFFVGYFIFEVPSNLILERVGARVWIARIMVLWGIISGCMMFVTTPTQFYVLRFALGAAEAGFFPGIILYLTYWFPAAYRSRTIAVFMTAAVLSNVIGAPLSGWLLGMDGIWGLRGWKWLFLIEALPSVILGLVVFLKLPRGPRDAHWMTAAECAWLEARLAADQHLLTGGHKLPLLKTLIDPRVLVLSLVYFTNALGGYGLDFFQPTLIKQAFTGASTVSIGFLSAIPALAAVFVMVLWGRSSDRRGERRWHFAIAIWASALGLLIASLPVPPWLALAAMALSVCGRWSGVAPFWSFSTTMLSGTALAGAVALVNSIGNLGGALGPELMGQVHKRTGHYTLALQILAGLMFLGGILVLRLRSPQPAVAVFDANAVSQASP